ncbi:MAG TPA: glycosyltransferase family 39 protein [Thermomicrobiales bacterium]|nr:glycosyltransferase family 39 protein [Thermomicrobiales bacterium]
MQAHDRDPSMPPPESPQASFGIFQAYRRPPWASWAVPVLLALVLFTIAFAHYESDVDTTAFHPDESRWLNRAHYLEDLLDPFGTTWNDQYLTRGQPPMGSYVMGIGLLVQGSDLDTNRAWEYRRGGEWNVANGMYPTPEDLRTGRMTNVFIGSLAVVVTFLAIRLLSNNLGGVIGALILTFHPLQSWHNRLALADTTLTLTLAALVLALILLVRRPSWYRALAVGILIGLGGANKLTPMALAFVIAGVGAVLLTWTLYRNNRNRLQGEPWYSVIPGSQHLSWMLLSAPVIAGATFVAVYPYLWRNPIEHTLLLLDFRQNEMENQARLYPQFAVETTGEAIQKTWDSLAGRWSATEWIAAELGADAVANSLAPLDLILAIIGTVSLITLAVQLPLKSGHLIVALILLVQVVTIILAMRTDFERYYLPIVLSIAILAGTGVGVLSQTISHAWRARRSAPAQQRSPARTVSHRSTEATRT